MPEAEARFFRTPEDCRAWLGAHAAEGGEIWVGFFKRGAGESGLTRPESVDQALCFGWIDGRRQSIDANRYRIRFTPRRASTRTSRPASRCSTPGRRRASASA
jgi:uncharacterized protein YdeI (YjbR/CyaY-like superfamily)